MMQMLTPLWFWEEPTYLRRWVQSNTHSVGWQVLYMFCDGLQGALWEEAGQLEEASE